MEEKKNNASSQKIDWKKFLDKKYWKVYVAILVGVLLVVGLVVGLTIAGNQEKPEETTPDNSATNTPVEKDYTLAIGVVVAKDLEGLKLDETVATIVTDANGKIVLCSIDQ